MRSARLACPLELVFTTHVTRAAGGPYAISVMHSAWSEDVCSHQPMRGLVLCRSEGYFVAPHIACQARMRPSA